MSLDSIDPANSGGSVAIPSSPFSRRLKPQVFPCDECDLCFNDLESLRNHRLERHRLERPYLLISGRKRTESIIEITESIDIKDVFFVSATEISIDHKSMDTETAKTLIAKPKRRSINLVLRNKNYPVQQEIRYNILSADVAATVEKAFIETNRQKRDREPALTLFHRDIEHLETAGTKYASAFQAYLVGIMAKERDKKCVIPYEQHQEKLEEASETLKKFGSRPYAAVVVSLVDIMLGKFIERDTDGYFKPLQTTKAALYHGEFVSDVKTNNARSTQFPLDQITIDIISFATQNRTYRDSFFEKYETRSKSKLISPQDKHNIQLLLLGHAVQTQNEIKAEEYYEILRHQPNMNARIDKIYEKL